MRIVIYMLGQNEAAIFGSRQKFGYYYLVHIDNAFRLRVYKFLFLTKDRAGNVTDTPRVNIWFTGSSTTLLDKVRKLKISIEESDLPHLRNVYSSTKGRRGDDSRLFLGSDECF